MPDMVLPRVMETKPDEQSPGTFHKLSTILLVALFLAAVVATILIASVPPTSRDALIHHLAVPKAYLRHGELVEMLSMRFSYYPMNVDLLYMLPLAWGNDVIPKYIHLVFALLTAILIWRYLKRRSGNIWGLIGALLFLTTPIVFKLATIAYVDLALVFFSYAAILALLRWQTTGFQVKYLMLSAGFCGLALGTKYNGLMFMLIMMVLMPWLFLRGIENNQDSEAGVNLRRLMASQVFYIFIALVLFSPWMLRNYNWTGNPVYPLYDGIFNPSSSTSVAEKELRPSGPDMNPLFIRRAVYGETWFQILLSRCGYSMKERITIPVILTVN